MNNVFVTCARPFFLNRVSADSLTFGNRIGVNISAPVRFLGARGGNNKSGLSKFRKRNSFPVASAGKPIGGPLLKPTLFTGATCFCAFTGAAIYRYEDLRDRAKRFSNSLRPGVPDSVRDFFNFNRKSPSWREWMNESWNQLSVGEKMALSCAVVNLGVFVAWRLVNPAVMSRYFTSSPFGKSPCLSMFLHMFSHTSFVHLAINMICLWSFAPSIVNAIGKEQTVALYVSAGMVSALASSVYKVALGSKTISVGASGAILGLAAAVCTQYPDTKLAIIFLPMFPIAAKYALGTMFAFDTAGVFLRWKFFDHASHLGGSLFGAGFVAFGQHYVLKYQKEFIDFWHELRVDS